MPRQSIPLRALGTVGAIALVAGIAACGIKGPLRPPPKSAATPAAPPATTNPATPPATTSPALPPPNTK